MTSRWPIGGFPDGRQRLHADESAGLEAEVTTFVIGLLWGVYAWPTYHRAARESDGRPHGTAPGAVISPGAFRSHAYFYGDATVLAVVAALSRMLLLGLGFML